MAHFLEAGDRSVTPDYYALLEVAPEAEHEIIRAAYLVLAKRYHPDTATAASPHNDGKFHLITEAYEILRDPELRAQYDSDHARQKRGLAQREKFDDAHRRARKQAQRKQRERAVRNLLVVVFAVGGFALGALAVGLIKAPGPDSLAANTDPTMHTEKSNFLSDQAAQNQELTDLQGALQQERDKSEKLARELTKAWRELRSQTAALADNAAQHQELTDLRQALQQTERLAATNQELLAEERGRNQGLEQQLAARRDDQKLVAQERARIQELKQQLATQQDDQKLLAQERARTQELEEQLAARRDTTPHLGRSVEANRSGTADPTPAPATDKPPTAPLPPNDKPVMPASDWPATTPARPTAPEAEAPGNPEPARLMARASLLLDQGNIGTARIVLERAAEMGSARALFALAETYDPVLLSAWGTFGTQGDVGKAQELYAKAFAGGIREAKDRLNASRW